MPRRWPETAPGERVQPLPRDRIAAALGGLPGFGEFTDFIGLPQVREAEQRYAGGIPSR
jgi:hypothetical protein